MINNASSSSHEYVLFDQNQNSTIKFILLFSSIEIDIKVDEIEDLNVAIQERKTQKPGMVNRDAMGAPVLPPPPQSLFSILDGANLGVTPR